jgi:hypothetical protein
MFKALVTLQILDFEALNNLERTAAKITADYQGKVFARSRLHALQMAPVKKFILWNFFTKNIFPRYKNDPRLKQLCDLRARAITSTEIKIGINEKFY